MRMTIHPFETTDFYLASFLLSQGMRMLELKTVDNYGRKAFVFGDTTERAKLVNEYHLGNPTVDVRNFVASIRRLKSGMYDGV